VIYNNYHYNNPMDALSSATPTLLRPGLNQALVDEHLALVRAEGRREGEGSGARGGGGGGLVQLLCSGLYNTRACGHVLYLRRVLMYACMLVVGSQQNGNC
jgi:hypothetical protein